MKPLESYLIFSSTYLSCKTGRTILQNHCLRIVVRIKLAWHIGLIYAKGLEQFLARIKPSARVVYYYENIGRTIILTGGGSIWEVYGEYRDDI